MKVKSFILAVMLVLNQNLVHAQNNQEPNLELATNKVNKKLIKKVMLPVGILGVTILAVIVVYKFVNKKPIESDASDLNLDTFPKFMEAVENDPINLGRFWESASKAVGPETAEAFEFKAKAESSKNLNINNTDTNRIEVNYDNASKKYLSRIPLTPIDAALGYNAQANSWETTTVRSLIQCGIAAKSECLKSWKRCGEAKPSYKLYSEARIARLKAVISDYRYPRDTKAKERSIEKWKKAAIAYHKLQTDGDLKASFGGDTYYWHAYSAFATANELECRHKVNPEKTPFSEVHDAWKKTAELDFNVAQSASDAVSKAHFLAFAADALNRSFGRLNFELAP
ncbi:MAG: hypothetical protein NkDv07_0925 [Candidatus Improbicoccus devescovinae]|nr:MAG: hypothetical protein NkDv07_0925 [Candidatus Improbicoccus devescovinae]